MQAPRIIPCLLLKGCGLVKTVRFSNPAYLGDPRNVVKIFNDKEVDELAILDILATPEKQGVNYSLIEEIVSEAFMPVAYGGGIRSLEDARRILSLGVEKIVLNSVVHENLSFIREAASLFGNQSVVISIDAKKASNGSYQMFYEGGRKFSPWNIFRFVKAAEEMGAGEIFLNSIDQDGEGNGYDLDLVSSITSILRIPVIACGGAGRMVHFRDVVQKAGAAAAAAGSMFVFHGKHKAVLISYPSPAELKELWK